MFAWQPNRVKPKMKSTYTRKKSSLGSMHSAGADETSSQIGDASRAGSEENHVDDDMSHDNMDATSPSHTGFNIQSEYSSMSPGVPLAAHGNLDVTPLGSTANSSAAVAGAANIEMDQEVPAIYREGSSEDKEIPNDARDDVDEEMSDGGEEDMDEEIHDGGSARNLNEEIHDGGSAVPNAATNTNIQNEVTDKEVSGDEAEEPLYEVEYFLADDYMKVPHSLQHSLFPFGYLQHNGA